MSQYNWCFKLFFFIYFSITLTDMKQPLTIQTSMDGDAGVTLDPRQDTPTTVVPPATPARLEVSAYNVHVNTSV